MANENYSMLTSGTGYATTGAYETGETTYGGEAGMASWIGPAIQGAGSLLGALFGGGEGEGETSQVAELQSENSALANALEEAKQSKWIWVIGAAAATYIVSEKL